MDPGFPQRVLWEQFRAPMSGWCSEPSPEETCLSSWTRKKKLAGEVSSLRLPGMTIPISSFKTAGSGKRTLKIKTAAVSIFLIFPRETPMASDFAGAGGLICAGISFPDKANTETAEITRNGSAGARAGAARDRSTQSRWGAGAAVCSVLTFTVVRPGPEPSCPQLRFSWGTVLPLLHSWLLGSQGRGSPTRAGRGEDMQGEPEAARLRGLA